MGKTGAKPENRQKKAKLNMQDAKSCVARMKQRYADHARIVEQDASPGGARGTSQGATAGTAAGGAGPGGGAGGRTESTLRWQITCLGA